MAFNCDPAVCPDQHFRGLETFRRAVLVLLARIVNSLSGSLIPVQAVYPELASKAADADLDTSTFVTVLPSTDNLRSIVITNDTDKAIYVSYDGTLAHRYIPSKVVWEEKLGDIQRSHSGVVAVKLAEDTTTGSVYVGGVI